MTEPSQTSERSIFEWSHDTNLYTIDSNSNIYQNGQKLPASQIRSYEALCDHNGELWAFESTKSHHQVWKWSPHQSWVVQTKAPQIPHSEATICWVSNDAFYLFVEHQTFIFENDEWRSEDSLSLVANCKHTNKKFAVCSQGIFELTSLSQTRPQRLALRDIKQTASTSPTGTNTTLKIVFSCIAAVIYVIVILATAIPVHRLRKRIEQMEKERMSNETTDMAMTPKESPKPLFLEDEKADTAMFIKIVWVVICIQRWKLRRIHTTAALKIQRWYRRMIERRIKEKKRYQRSHSNLLKEIKKRDKELSRSKRAESRDTSKKIKKTLQKNLGVIKEQAVKDVDELLAKNPEPVALSPEEIEQRKKEKREKKKILKEKERVIAAIRIQRWYRRMKKKNNEIYKRLQTPKHSKDQRILLNQIQESTKLMLEERKKRLQGKGSSNDVLNKLEARGMNYDKAEAKKVMQKKLGKASSKGNLKQV